MKLINFILQEHNHGSHDFTSSMDDDFIDGCSTCYMIQYGHDDMFIIECEEQENEHLQEEYQNQLDWIKDNQETIKKHNLQGMYA